MKHLALGAFLLALSVWGVRAQEAIVSFTFDDVPKSVATVGMPLLAKYGYPATVFVETRNTDGNYPDYMNWDDVEAVSKAGWEVGAHTHTHPHLTKLSDMDIFKDLMKSMDDFAAHGYDPVDFASPYGEVDQRVLRIIKIFYHSQRDAWPAGVNNLPLADPYHIASYEITRETTLAEVMSLLDKIQLKGGWLVLQVHGVTPKGQPVEDPYNTNLLEDILEQVHAKNLPVLTVRQALAQLNQKGGE